MPSFEEIIAAYTQALRRGVAPTRGDFLKQHPEHADRLNDFLDIEAWLHDTRPTPFDPVDARVNSFGDYDIYSEVARGAMGVVFRARQRSLNRVVALKMILAGELADEDQVRRFRGEAEAVAGLEHPHIVPIYEVGEHNGRHYFSMKLIEGRSLAECMSEYVGQPHRTAKLMANVARAVHFAHQRGVLHRDLKPGNILIDGNGEPHVADFGLAKRAGGESGATLSGAIVGTPAYMSPEQARAEKGLTTATDVYSLGTILYECLTGRPPFRGETVLDILAAVLSEEPSDPRSVNALANADLGVIALKCLHKERHRRYDSASALADDLERWLRGEPILARPVGNVERVRRWCTRNPAITALSAGLTMILFGGTVLALFFATWLLIALVALVLTSATAVSLGLAFWALREARRANLNAHQAEQHAAEAQIQRRQAEKNAAEAQEQRRRADEQAVEALTQQREAIEQRTIVERMVYAERLSSAQTAWEKHDVDQVARHLDGCAAPLRGWVHRYLSVRLQRASRVLRGHTDTVVTLDWSLDGKYIVSGSWDLTLRIWDASTLSPVRVLTGHREAVDYVVFSPDGAKIASVSMDSVLKVWDTSTGQELHSLQSRIAADWSPDSARLACISVDGDIEVRNAETQEIVVQWPSGWRCAHVEWSPNGRQIVSVRHHEVFLWDASTGKDMVRLEGHDNRVISMAWSRDGRFLATGSRADRDSASFDLSEVLKIWNARTGQEYVSLQGQLSRSVGRGHIRGLEWSSDATRLYASGWGKGLTTWAIGTGEIIDNNPFVGEQFICSPVNGRVAHCRRNDIILTELVLREDVIALDVMEKLVVWSPDLGHVALLGPYHSFRIQPLIGEQQSISCERSDDMFRLIVWSPDGRFVASAGSDTSVTIWNPEFGEPVIHYNGHLDPVLSLAWSPNGETILSSDEGGTIHWWSIATGKAIREPTHRIMPDVFQTLCWNPDGQHLACGHDNNVAIWHPDTGKTIGMFLQHQDRVNSVSWSPDGSRVASCDANGTAWIWNADSGEGLVSHRGFSGVLAWSPDGKRLAGTGADGTLVIWEPDIGAEILVLSKANLGGDRLVWSTDGLRLAYGNCVYDASPVV